jgi:hypothetical protein
LKPIQDWLNSTSIADAVGAWAMKNIVNPIVSAITSAAKAISSFGGGGGSSGGATGSWQDSSVLASGGSASGGDAGTLNLGDLGGGTGGATDNLPAFATGGQFTVAGAGGTDSQMVNFMATPGEVSQ